MDLVGSNITLFDDDTTLYLIVDNPLSAAETLNFDLSSLNKWASDWLITFSALQIDLMTISRETQKATHPPIVFQKNVLHDVTHHKHLGVTLRADLRWADHIKEIVNKSNILVNIMKRLNFPLIETLSKLSIFRSFDPY